MKFLALFPLFLFLASCSTQVEQPTITKLDTAKYAGLWHEIGRLPNPFEKNVVAATATYGALPNGSLSVKNNGLKSNGERTEIEGSVTQPDPKQPGKLVVRFDRFPASLFAGDYWILALSQDHTRAMIGSPNQKYLWFLSKREGSQKNNFADFLKTADKLGYSTADVYWNPKRLSTHP
ncbi:MAG: lipocalin family protein [Roseibacillus sp.]